MIDVRRPEGLLRRRATVISLQPLAVILVLLASFSPAALHAAERSAMVIDANTGKVLYAADADERRYPASLTKMMTLYLTFELIEKKRLAYDNRIKISAQAASQPPSKLDLDAGDTISVRDAVKALVTKSANDIAVALAEHIAGSETNFARLMTAKAREIGMSKTTFRNASGLPNTEQLTTARDMLTLAIRLQDDFPEHYKVFATRSFTYKGSSFRNHNTLLYHYQGTEGIKTGYTRASGFNLVASVKRGGKHLVASVFGGRTAGQRNATMRSILDRAFQKASGRRTRQAAPMLIAAPRLSPRPAPSKLAPTKPPPLPELAPAEVAATAPPAASPKAVRPSLDERISIARVRRIGLGQHFAGRRTKPAPVAAAPQPDHAANTANAAKSADPGAPMSIAELIASTARSSAASHRASTLGVQVDGAVVPAPGPATPVGLGTFAAAPTKAPAPPSATATVVVPQTDPAPAEQAALPAPAPAPTARSASRTEGRSPSTLQEQLSNILSSHRPKAAETARIAPADRGRDRPQLRATLPPATGDSEVDGTHLVQIGAYASAGEAEQRLANVRQSAPGVLSRAAPRTEPVTRGSRQLYRAHFAGFDSGGATEACQELRRRSIDCFVKKVR